MMDLSITKEEREALEFYRNKNYEAINQMLVCNSETDIALLSADVENKVVSINYDREAIIKYLKTIKVLYRLLLKKYYSNKLVNKTTIYRGTNIAELERIINELYIDRFLMGTQNQKNAIKNANNWNRSVCLNIELDGNIPYIFLKDILKGREYKEEILISPFTKIKTVTEEKEIVLEENSKTIKVYDLELEKQVLDELSSHERNGLYNYILENSYSIKRKIEECIDLEKENVVNFENIRKLEQLLVKYENVKEEKDNSLDNEIDVEKDPDDILRISNQLEELKTISNNIFEKRKKNIEFINMWKRDIAVYMIAECREIEKEFENGECPKPEVSNVKVELPNEEPEKPDEEPKKSEEELSDDESIKIEENHSSDNKQPIVNNETIEENLFEDLQDEDKTTLAYRVKIESKENIEQAEELLKNIKLLISKQQNHAKIAGNAGASYSALNNAFEMKKNADSLLNLLKDIHLKIKEVAEKPKTKKNKEKLEKISKINIEISTLMNYLNNPKIAAISSNATRFDEMAIIEENELKKGIYERILSIRGEAELKKLKEDLELIENKGPISKFFGIFTGKNKLDEFMIDQIDIRQKAIRRTLSKHLDLAYNYSIHQFMAEIEMFIEENEDDELVEDEVTDLKALAEELRRNFVILDTKVQSIIEEREGRNLPLPKRKLSKQEIIEVETYRFLNKYGYDNVSNKTEEEPKYQDTMANEISRIIEYINSSEIF